jgi:hypothetical protein
MIQVRDWRQANYSGELWTVEENIPMSRKRGHVAPHLILSQNGTLLQ